MEEERDRKTRETRERRERDERETRERRERDERETRETREIRSEMRTCFSSVFGAGKVCEDGVTWGWQSEWRKETANRV
jgi:hypothetical protein